MATTTDAAGAVVGEPENRPTLRDPIRESEGSLFFILFKGNYIPTSLFIL